MPYEYQCPANECEFSVQDNDYGTVVESAQQHHGDKHGNTATRDEVEESIIGT